MTVENELRDFFQQERKRFSNEPAPGEFSLADYVLNVGCGESTARRYLKSQVEAGRLTKRRLRSGVIVYRPAPATE